MPDNLKWDTRLEVKLGTETISPIDAFTPTFAVPVTVQHSIERDNVAHIVGPHTCTFSMTIKAIGPAVAKLTELALTQTPFSIAVSEKRGADWTFKSMAFNDCYVTSANPGNITIDGVPTATFTCISLDFSEQAAT